MKKLGIVKPKRPLLIGSSVNYEISKKYWESLGSHIYRQTYESKTKDYTDENNDLARLGFNILREIGSYNLVPFAEEALKANPICRFERFSNITDTHGNIFSEVFLDVGHNPQAIERVMIKLRHFIKENLLNGDKKFNIIFGWKSNKDMNGMIEILKNNPDLLKNVVLIPVEEKDNSDWKRNISKHLTVKDYGLKSENSSEVNFFSAESVESAFSKIIELNSKNVTNVTEPFNGILIVGSFFWMGKARKHLGIKEELDSDILDSIGLNN